ncbi:hypothetical protein [Streptomyces cyaneofuscatus]|uniref:hypothetical protein n=1 Tax=Streptomyces cyaneofuscatus TaxID=66883 RepID=UPI0036DE638D
MRDTHHRTVRTANEAIADEAQARESYMRKIASATAIDANHLGPVLAAAGYAAPWRKVLTLLHTRPLADAVTTIRDHSTRILLERSETQSTSALTNEQARTEREALRRFLDRTDGTVERLQQEADEECTRGACPACTTG